MPPAVTVPPTVTWTRCSRCSRLAARFTDSGAAGRARLFLDSLTGQEIAGDTLAERAVREDCVRVLTAHRSKGLEWDVVIVAGVQEETWPDLRLRGSLLGADELAEATGESVRIRRPPERRETSPPPRWPPSCSPRSGGCSTSRSPGPGSCSW